MAHSQIATADRCSRVDRSDRIRFGGVYPWNRRNSFSRDDRWQWSTRCLLLHTLAARWVPVWFEFPFAGEKHEAQSGKREGRKGGREPNGTWDGLMTFQ